MKLSLKYFGQIAEKTGTSNEVFNSEDKIKLKDLKNVIHEKYSLNGLPFQLAVNKEVAEDDMALNENDEVAFLPPFAGG